MIRSLVCLLALLLIGVQTLDAQCRNRRCRRPDPDRVRVVRIIDRTAERPAVEFGVRGGYDFDANVGAAGAQLRIPLIRPLLLAPSGDVLFDDAATEWQLNADLLFRPAAFGGLYTGVGAALIRREPGATGDTETDAGLNLLLGLEGRRIARSSVRPFAEARWTLASDDYDPFRLLAGINVPVTGGPFR